MALRTAALDWMAYAAAESPPKWGVSVIPFLGQLRAVTGAGKTPILANVVGELGPGVILWTSRSSAVVEQTYNNLRGKYASELPVGVKVVRDFPGQSEWRALIDSENELTIWLLTVGSWNEAEAAQGAGSEEARLNLHRVHPDWAGDTSPWDQLRNELLRPLWIVSDESHNQSTTQLDQLADLRPKGFFMASATPVQNERFAKWSEALTADATWKALADAGVVKVRTKDVVEAQLLKTTINIIDYNSGTEESLDGALEAFRALEEAVAEEGSSVAPRAIYVVERSNPVKGSPDPSRPVVIWQHLVAAGVPMDEIAVYTDTKVLPEGAEKVASLSGLHPRYRHIIFNQTLQEGWDDPEAYVCYFDGVTKSYTRIKQIVGRVLRQPMSRHSSAEALNTATLIVNVPAASYDTVLDELKAEMRLYAPEDEPNVPTIKIKTRKDPLAPVAVKPDWTDKLTLPNRALKAPNMAPAVKIIRSAGRKWDDPSQLDHPGRGRLTVLSLAKEAQEREDYLHVVRSARTNNGIFLRRYIQQRNRACLHAIHPDEFKGEGFAQESCLGSAAQTELRAAGDRVVEHYEAGVEYELDPDPDRATWIVSPHHPRGRDMVTFKRAAHKEYAAADMNQLEREFAGALDAVGKGVWVRNPATPTVGFSIPLPAKVGESSRFYPDFLWWLDDGTCWAIDPTGQHLLDAKVRGKLVALDNPRVGLVARGHIELPGGTTSGADGWSVVHARKALPASSQYFESLAELLDSLTQ